MRAVSWAKHLFKRRKSRFFRQMWRMWKFHRTSFSDILQDMFDVLAEYDSRFTFPTVASVAITHPEYVSQLKESPHEIASHGYKHVKYQFLSYKAQWKEFMLSSSAFKSLNVKIRGFRAPYNSYTADTLELIEKFGYDWDIGIGFTEAYYKEGRIFQPLREDGTKYNFFSVPLSRWSDDKLIDKLQLNTNQMVKIYEHLIHKTAQKEGILMLELHPIRIGQKKYLPVLQKILEVASSEDAWIPTVSDAIAYWNAHKRWKNAKFCLLLTGDIDNFTFTDYLRRLF